MRKAAASLATATSRRGVACTDTTLVLRKAPHPAISIYFVHIGGHCCVEETLIMIGLRELRSWAFAMLTS